MLRDYHKAVDSRRHNCSPTTTISNYEEEAIELLPVELANRIAELTQALRKRPMYLEQKRIDIRRLDGHWRAEMLGPGNVAFIISSPADLLFFLLQRKLVDPKTKLIRTSSDHCVIRQPEPTCLNCLGSDIETNGPDHRPFYCRNCGSSRITSQTRPQTA